MKMLLIALICLLMTGCADDYIDFEATTTPEQNPLNGGMKTDGMRSWPMTWNRT